MVEFAIIVACSEDGGIARSNSIPWHIPEDTKYFRDITTNSQKDRINAIIMGRKTWETISTPLPGRINIVISKTLKEKDLPYTVILARSLNHAHMRLKEISNIGTVFVIGGESLYREAIYDHHYTKLYLTIVFSDNLKCDRFFPIEIAKKRYELDRSSIVNYYGTLQYQFLTYSQKDKDEFLYDL